MDGRVQKSRPSKVINNKVLITDTEKANAIYLSNNMQT